MEMRMWTFPGFLYTYILLADHYKRSTCQCFMSRIGGIRTCVGSLHKMNQNKDSCLFQAA
jgi:hypothetical protein